VGGDALMTTAGQVKQVFVDLHPGLLSLEHLRVTVGSGNRLEEVWICLTADRQPVPTACPPGGTPDAQRVRVLAPR
jgi:ribonuclease T2